jgi:hypothetical protein
MEVDLVKVAVKDGGANDGCQVEQYKLSRDNNLGRIFSLRSKYRE